MRGVWNSVRWWLALAVGVVAYFVVWSWFAPTPPRVIFYPSHPQLQWWETPQGLWALSLAGAGIASLLVLLSYGRRRAMIAVAVLFAALIGGVGLYQSVTELRPTPECSGDPPVCGADL